MNMYVAYDIKLSKKTKTQNPPKIMRKEERWNIQSYGIYPPK